MSVIIPVTKSKYKCALLRDISHEGENDGCINALGVGGGGGGGGSG